MKVNRDLQLVLRESISYQMLFWFDQENKIFQQRLIFVYCFWSYRYFYANTYTCVIIIYVYMYLFIFMLGILQITSLKFGSIQILHSKILEFGFYSPEFRGAWILQLNVSEFEFYTLKVWKCLDFTALKFETSWSQIQTPLNFGE